MHALFLTTDLFFSSRVSSLAREAGVTIDVRSSIDEDAVTVDTRLAIIDLGLRGLDIDAVTKQLQTGNNELKIIAYGPHVNAELLEMAKRAGCDTVMPRSQFDQQIGAILRDMAETS